MTKVTAKRRSPEGAEGDPLWYKDAIFYEARVRSFYDSNDDGVGDFRGLIEKLDYLQDLGVTALWLLPFYPSPLRDDGYDISDYRGVHPDCGTLRDFKAFLREAHRRGLRVVTELVINHTSDQHPWFQRARRSPPQSRWRDFYVWSDTPDKYKGVPIIFSDFEPSNWTWDPVTRAYYWHRFFANQPDLNYDNPDVHEAIFEALDFWLDLGVDGLRLDAIPYLYEREGTTCDNLPETHAFLRDLRQHVDARYRNRMLLAEANHWPEDAVAYFGAGDECHMAFHFPIMPRLFMALHMEDRFPIIDILEQTPELPDSSQWALFLRNHDELTLEMVTDEERDYMYRVYAHDSRARINLGIRRRLAPLLGNERRRIELMNALLFSLPGTPILYYGDEIGMGDNIYLGDRNGVRTPMQWSPDRNAGFSRANPQRLYLPVIIDPEYHYETVNVESQRNNPHSLLWWTKRLIALRKRYRAFGRGTIQFLSPNNRKVLAFTRHHGDENLLIVANLSRFVQFVELDLSAYKGMVAFEMFGRTEFPAIGDQPYLLTLGPHSFYWFSLETPPSAGAALAASSADTVPPSLTVRGTWEAVLRGEARTALERTLPAHLGGRRWFAGRGLTVRSARIIEQVELPADSSAALLTLVQVDYTDGGTDTYVLPLAFANDSAPARDGQPRAGVARLTVRTKDATVDGVLYDAAEDGDLALALLDAIGKRRSMKGRGGEIAGVPTSAFRSLRGDNDEPLIGAALRGERSNTTIAYGQRLVLKLFRRVHEGPNPEVEIARFMTERMPFTHVAPMAGHLEYRRAGGATMSVGVLQGFVPNEGDAWAFTLDEIGRYLEHALARHDAVSLPEGGLVALTQAEPPGLARDLLGAQLESARLLGHRTAEMHLALASASADDPDFAPQPFTLLYQRSLYQSLRNLNGRVFRLARERLKTVPEGAAEQIGQVIGCEREVLSSYDVLLERQLAALRIRCHGDYHLGQVLFTGKDFVIIDFEGESLRSLGDRRRKRSPMHDLAAMIRSFDYAAHTAVARFGGPGDRQAVESWARFWYWWFSSAFLKAYLRQIGESAILPRSAEDREALLYVHLLEKSVSQLGTELNDRPDWIHVPARAILELLRRSRQTGGSG